MAQSKEERAEYMRNYRMVRQLAGHPVRDSSSWTDNQTARYRKYGLTRESYLAMYNAQSGTCKICKVAIRDVNTATDRGNNTHIDHCHVSGRVRGLLCHHCNLGVGNFRDSPTFLAAAIEYLKP